MCGCKTLVLVWLAAAAAAARSPSAPAETNKDLASLSLEELTQIKVTSFRNKAQDLSRVAGAVYVITREQIERSGLSSVPELLRLAPGVHVAQTNAGQWAVGARGPAGVFQARLLVLIDGRSIYTPVFSGVYWDMGMPPLEDIDRIEIIRGPGATIWGANAVLGVINIVTRNSRDTTGTLVSTGGGSRKQAFGRVRYGASSGNLSWRAHALVENHAALSRPDGGSAGDRWNTEQVGFRMDSERERASWMLSGSASVNSGELTGIKASAAAQGFFEQPLRMVNATGNVTGEYRRAVGKTGELRANFYFDQVRRKHTSERIAHSQTWNGDIRYDLRGGERHSLSVGGGVRGIRESVPGTGGLHFDPPSLSYANYNVFAQDEIGFFRDRFVLTFGVRLEHTGFTGMGTEPSASLLWLPLKRHSFWVSAARALRTPSYVERALTSALLTTPGSPVAFGLPVSAVLKGSPEFGNEAVNDIQVGYRADLFRTLSVSVSLYRDRYQQFRATAPGLPSFQMLPVPSLSLTMTAANTAEGTGKGVETSVAWQPFRKWKLEGSHTYAMTRIQPEAGASPGTVVVDAFSPPRNQWVAQSLWSPARSIEVDISSFWYGRKVSSGDLGRLDMPAYTRLDLRIGYKIGERWTLSVTGQNLLTPRHAEGQPESLTAFSYVTRGVYLKSVWRF